MTKPTISVVIATFNSDRTLVDCLTSLRSQNYPQANLELIISDGGSTDGTLRIAKKYGAKVVAPKSIKQGAEYNKAFGIQFAHGQYILCIDHDNILPHPNWINSMLLPFLTNPKLVAVEPLRYHYDPKLSLLDRYFALFGVNDPLPYYLGKADRMDYFHEKYNLLGQAIDKDEYYLVEFDQTHPKNIPTLGANGFLIKKSAFLRSRHGLNTYFHIDINVDLVSQGFTQYAFTKDTIIHLTNSRLISFVKRRAFFMSKYYLQDQGKRRYSVFDSKTDLTGLIVYVIFSLTIIKPLIDSVRGFTKIHDFAWFIHPIMCFMMVNIYAYTLVVGKLQKVMRV